MFAARWIRFLQSTEEDRVEFRSKTFVRQNVEEERRHEITLLQQIETLLDRRERTQGGLARLQPIEISLITRKINGEDVVRRGEEKKDTIQGD